MKNGFLMALGVAIWAALKQIFKFVGTIIQFLTSLFLFLGLYIPLFYVMFGLILLVATPFTFGGTGTYQILYYVGLGLSCLAAVIISVRNLLVKPISSIFSVFRKNSKDRYDDEADEDDDRRYGDEKRRDRRDAYRGREDDYPPRGDYPPRDAYAPRSYGYPPRDEYAPYPYDGYPPREGRYGYPPAPRYSRPQEDYDMRFRGREEGERPLVYYSQRRPGVLVEEYSDRFELYREEASGRVHIGTEYKDD